MSQPTSFTSRVSVEPSPPAPIVPSYLLVDRGGKRYRVELFEVDAHNTIVHDKLDDQGNWQETAVAVVDCIQALDGYQQTSQGPVFDFNHFQTFEMNIVYTPNQPQITAIPQFRWTADEARSIPRPSPQQQVIHDTLTRLGTALSAPPTRVEPVRYHADGIPYLSDLTFPDPTPEQAIIPSQTPVINGNPEYYPVDRRWIETGGGGDCGVYSLMDAQCQRTGYSYPSQEEWQAGLTLNQPRVRYTTSQDLFNRCTDNQFIHDHFEDRILPDIRAQEENGQHLIRTTLSPSNQKIFTDLLGLHPDHLNLEQKRWLAQVYAIYISESGRDIDSTFFLAYALTKRLNVAIVTEQSGTFTINPVFPLDVPDRILDPKNTLFIRSDPAGGHHQSVNCTHPDFQAMIDAYNTRPPAGTA